LLDLGWDYRCSVCDLTSWQNRPISLHLDHINGISDDNRLENLRFLCPNCHQQTDTWGSKNKKSKVLIPDFKELIKLVEETSTKEVASKIVVVLGGLDIK
jgi:5-methylcytosine-specific restriction endonuclease McrA